MASTEAQNQIDPNQAPTDEQKGEILVSEYPPPPHYYTHSKKLSPPPIPVDAFVKASENAILQAASAAPNATGEPKEQHPPDIEAENVADDLVGVFREVVEDPLLVYQHFVDKNDEDPKITFGKINKLNDECLTKFIELVNDLVYRPKENKAKRDEVSNLLMQMMIESNNFRSHQAREILIELLEYRLSEKKKALDQLKIALNSSNEVLDKIKADGS